MNALNIMKIDYVEFYVENLFQACYFYEHAMGFTRIGYRGPQHSIEMTTSMLLKQNDIYIVLTTSLLPHSLTALHVHEHGDGVKDIAFFTNDVKSSFQEAVKRGANVVTPPTIFEDDKCKIIKAVISTFGDTHHSFIERDQKSITFLPDFVLYPTPQHLPQFGLQSVDHVAVCVEQGSLLKWNEFYKNVLGFHQFHQEEIYTGSSGMNSFALHNSKENPSFSMVLVEPINGVTKSQVQEFIDYYGTAGVQHMAFLSNNILQSVKAMRESNIPFLPIPKTYYEELQNKVNNLKTNMNSLQELQILVDQDKDGDLYQAFSKIIQSRPTFFIEVIQRQGAKGFGSRNIKKLFESVEKEQKYCAPTY